LNGISLPGQVRSIVLSGEYAYVSDKLAGIDIVDIEPWAEMKHLSSHPTVGVPYRLINKGPLILLLYGLQSNDGWELFYRDTAGALNPVFYTDIPYSTLRDACIHQGNIYVCDMYGGLYIYQAW
jgi:hypothetical protein